jgi:hypothetical protein
MLFSVLPVASLAAFSLLSFGAAAAPTADDVHSAGPIKSNALSSNSGSGIYKRDNPIVYTWSNSNTCTGDWIRYSLGPGCYQVDTFESFSPTNNPGCIVTAYNGDGCDSGGIEFPGYANGQCVENGYLYPNGEIYIYPASWIGVSC